jgi:hypothetical protein
VVEPGPKIRVLTQSPTLILFVPAIDGQKVPFPCSHIATNDTPLYCIPPKNRERKTESLGGPSHLSGKEETESGNPLTRGQGGRSGLVEVAAAALDPKAGLGERGVVLDKAGMRNAVSVREHQVLAFGFSERTVENDILSKTFVFMPEMSGGAGQGGKQSLQNSTGVGSGAIIRDKNFPGIGGLIAESPQAKFQRAKMVIGADHHRNLGGGDHEFWMEPRSFTFVSRMER